VEIRLLFPVISANKTWGAVSDLDDPVYGPMVALNVTKQLLIDFGTNQARAEWIAPSSELGSATASLAYLVRNSTLVFGRGCSVDSRWSNGEAWNSGGVLNPWAINLGISPPPIQAIRPGKFMDVSMEYSDPIQATQEWLDFSTSFLESPGANGYRMDTFEALLNGTELSDPLWTSTDPVSRRLLEYITVLHFTDSLSRIGWDIQMKTIGNFSIDPIVQTFINRSWPNMMLSGGEIYQRPPETITPTSALPFYEYRQGFGWKTVASDTSTILAIVVLLIHALLAIIHCIHTIWIGRTSEAWDSISELMVLAYNSFPRGKATENCGSGIRLLRTLGSTAQVGVFTEGDDEADEQVELLINESSVSKDSVHSIISKPLPGEKYG
jgi:hypothetical protein